ncbi:hypothetical protein QNA08_07135 [Chelatococcus sp. SYSU_G07232]|uniref:DUF2474 domain-containing protein n=1 Tax=Chelatococcus albus TaxID=3047466 RepID=A0ABT7AFY0_9HYPH|nr:hypothetical protein [Chelatococcus sp. SYSU_G07232]MDJ1158005.1 hypothetical protein [Chelatococcus sp. SYSU_G07232]
MSNQSGWDSEREKRLWMIGYGALMLVVGLGAARQLLKLFG